MDFSWSAALTTFYLTLIAKRRWNTLLLMLLPAAGNVKFANYVKLKIAIKTFICQRGKQRKLRRRLKKFKIAGRTFFK